MKIVVQKYGGSSVATPERIKNVAKRVKKKVDEGYKVLVVVSAMGKTTDNLIKLAKEVSPKPDVRELDMLLATGEQVSAALLSMALKDLGVKAKSFNAFQIRIKTTSHHTSARIMDIDDSVIRENFENYDVLVVTGFQGINESGDLTTLGRGGSDTSAVALAAKLRVPCEIYSDVDGIYTCDPKIHPRARKLKYITYDEALELTALGAKVLHSRSIEIAKKYGIPIYCASSFIEEEGTMVVERLPEWLEEPVVTGAAISHGQIKVSISFLPKDVRYVTAIFEEVGKKALNVDMISLVPSNGNVFLSFTILEDHKDELDEALKEALKGVEGWQSSYEGGFAKLSIVGVGMRTSPGVAARFFEALEKVGVAPELVTTSEIKISCLVPEGKVEEALKSVIKEFNL
ncbi:aspartate kinase [Thermotoga sp. KOL6]|uniref:aspartate kinase n=1 Tax=Thermotoga sp. KOL6 TaxID=126741 RepID=UPI000C79216E|nr:aspartate kinase [Thermotoga sp. KOL6]PLV60248.1 aspartate kinase [Thermotoga sp. KOL6]